MKKIYVYPLSGLVPAIATALITILAVKLDVFTGISLGILALATGILTARLCFAIVKKGLYDSFIASEVWFAIGVGLYAWLIFNESVAVQTILVFSIMACAMNAIGFRFIAEKNEKEIESAAAPVVVPELSKKEKVAKMASEIRYRFMDDGVTPNLDAPLCVDEDGRHLTPAEADEKGLGALYAEAIEYIKSIVK